MLDSEVLSSGFITKALVFVGLMLVWNLAGRYRQAVTPAADDTPDGARYLAVIAGVIHVGVMSVVLFLVAVFLISGVIQDPTDFRYVSF